MCLASILKYSPKTVRRYAVTVSCLGMKGKRSIEKE